MSLLYRFFNALNRLFFRLFYSHEVYGLDHILVGRGIIAPNHASFFDPPIIGASWPEEVAFLARRSLFSSFLLGGLIRRLNAYPVNGTTQDVGTFKLISKLLNENRKVVIFPEGIRTFDGKLQPIKSGIGMLALRCNAPVIPAYIHGSYEVWNRKRRYPKLKGKTACVFGRPIYSEEFSHLEKKEAQEAMAKQIRMSIENLKNWYEQGAHGTLP